MSRKYQYQRKEEVRSRNSRQDLKNAGKILVNTTDKIICTSCGQFSGWTNDDIRYVSGEREIKCTNCGKPCIQTLCKNKSINNNSYDE